jgi:DNA repair exonuclease SbcCD ATPase subunit
MTGENGAGKSTFLDALTFVLYNKPFRKINKPQLVNSVNAKGCMVEIEFNIGDTEFFVRRGMKPNVFEIHENGKLLDQDGSITDYQNHLERNILKMNYTAFTQIVILGKATYVPFMRLGTPDRRQVIEDLLGLKIFSTMNKVLKEKVSSLKEKNAMLDADISVAQDKVDLREKYIQQLFANKEQHITKINNDIEELEATIAERSESVEKLLAEREELDGGSRGLKSLRTKRDKFNKFVVEFNSKVKGLRSDIKFLTDNESCPTCTQDITQNFRTKQIGMKESKIAKIEDGQSVLDKDLQEVESKLDEIESVLNEIRQIDIKLSSAQSSIAEMSKQITRMNQQKRKLDATDVSEEEAKVVELKKELSVLQDGKTDLTESGAYYTAIAGMLKDSGIKTLIIQKYLPIFNQLINQYLNQLGFFVKFELDEMFNETILSRYRDSFSYASFSEGQKLRIDLAILLTWREIAKLKNSLNTNLLIMDEVFDSSLDQEGVDAFVNMIPTMENTNIFVVSHTPDKLTDKFRSQISMKMEGNFSQMIV